MRQMLLCKKNRIEADFTVSVLVIQLFILFLVK